MLATQIYIASQTARELTVVDPPYTLVSLIFAICGLVPLLGGFVLLYFARVGFGRPLQVLMWFLPVLIGCPLLIVSAMTSGITRITLSADTNTLSVSKTILSVPVRSKEYPFAQVRMAKVGVGNVCRFLYVSLADKPAEDLTGCTDRDGYSEAADSINKFLDANRP